MPKAIILGIIETEKKISSPKRDNEFRYMVKDGRGDFYKFTRLNQKDGIEYDFFGNQFLGKCFKTWDDAEEMRSQLRDDHSSSEFEIVKVPRKRLVNEVVQNGTSLTITRKFTR